MTLVIVIHPFPFVYFLPTSSALLPSFSLLDNIKPISLVSSPHPNKETKSTQPLLYCKMSEIDNKLTLIQVLVQGQTFAKQLQILLGEPVVREDGFAASQLFVDQILTSFSESIDRINHQLPNENQTKGRGRRRRRSNSSDHHPYSCGGSTENRHDSRPSLTQDKRGCYKRYVCWVESQVTE